MSSILNPYTDVLAHSKSAPSGQAEIFSPLTDLFLGCSSTALCEFAVVVHGSGSPAWRLAALSPLRVQHPPWALPRSFILDAHKTTVQGQIVSDWVLSGRERKNQMRTWKSEYTHLTENQSQEVEMTCNHPNQCHNILLLCCKTLSRPDITKHTR